MDTLERLLREHPFLAGMSPEHLAFMTACARNERCAAGELLYREGDAADRLFLVRAGRVALQIHVPGRGAVVVETLQEGDVIGWPFLFPPYRWNEDARVVEAAALIAFDGVCLRAKLEADAPLGYALCLRLLRRVGDRLERVRLQRLDLYGAAP